MSIVQLKNQDLLYFFPAFGLMVLLFLLSAQPVLPGPSLVVHDFLFKKTGHIFMYGLLMTSWIFGFSRGFRKSLSNKELLASFILTVLYAATDEFHQGMVPGRTGTIRDIGYDSIGAAVALLAYKRFI